MKRKSCFYYLLIGLSAICLFGGIFLVMRGALSYISYRDVYENFHHGMTKRTQALICVGIGAGCLICFLPLTKIRQSLRDKVEYDDTGNRLGRKFSQLSRKEREALEKQRTMQEEHLLPTAELRSLTHEATKDPEQELDRLIGLSPVKKMVLEMRSRMEFEQQAGMKKNGERSSMSMVFLGRPGTGKTTVARIMAGFLYQYGYIKKRQTIEVNGNFINGLTAGESSQKINLLIKKARGGVLFIDEAYALVSSNQQEIIPTLIAAIENYRADTVFILAGYTNEMQTLLDTNPGFRSRIKYNVFFPDYNKKELCQIFLSMAHEKDFRVGSELLQKVGAYLIGQKSDPAFGNARSARTLLDQIIDKHAVRVGSKETSPKELMCLSQKDFPF